MLTSTCTVAIIRDDDNNQNMMKTSRQRNLRLFELRSSCSVTDHFHDWQVSVRTSASPSLNRVLDIKGTLYKVTSHEKILNSFVPTTLQDIIIDVIAFIVWDTSCDCVKVVFILVGTQVPLGLGGPAHTRDYFELVVVGNINIFVLDINLCSFCIQFLVNILSKS